MKFAVLALSFFVAVPAWAGSITIDLGGTPLTITTTPPQEAKVQRVTDAFNAAQGTNLTREQFTRNALRRVFREFIDRIDEQDAIAACKANPTLQDGTNVSALCP